MLIDSPPCSAPERVRNDLSWWVTLASLALLVLAWAPLATAQTAPSESPPAADSTAAGEEAEASATTEANDEGTPTDAASTTESEETPVAETLDEIVVSASYSLNRSDPVDRLPFSKDDIDQLPTFADDLYRAVALLPGTGGNDISARFTVRGGANEDVLVRLDGIELFEPFHLKDFAGVLSVLDPGVIDGIELLPGAFPARFGDRKAGVLDMTTGRASETRSELGASLSTATFLRSGLFGRDQQGSYVASLRRGWLDIVLDLVGDDDEEEGQEGAPEYWDVFGKLDWRLGERDDFSLWALAADDRLDEEEREEDGAFEKTDSQYGNQWLVARHQRLLSDRAVVLSRGFLGTVDRERLASESESETGFEVRDDRQLDVYGAAQDWSFDLGDRHLLSAGFEVRSYDATYDYSVARDFSDPIGAVGGSPTLDRFDDSIGGESYGFWVSDRWRLGPRVVTEVGLRWDRQTWLPADLDDDQLSPRLNLVWDLGTAGTVRAGWGRAFQSQRPNELGVEDGDTRFHLAERAEHRTLGWDRDFGKGRRLRIDLFQRLTDDPRPRWVSLFDPLGISPEGDPARFRLAPEESRAQGVEVFFQGHRGPRLGWWASYTWSEVEDRLDGAWVPRNIDQTHAFTANLSWRLGRRWNLDLVWLYHTGWPITEVTAQLVGGEVVPELGPLYGDRVDDYHRLDLRASRTFEFRRRGALELYIDVQNLYNRENERGYEFGEDAFELRPDGSVLVTPEIDTWLGMVPSFGVTWTF